MDTFNTNHKHWWYILFYLCPHKYGCNHFCRVTIMLSASGVCISVRSSGHLAGLNIAKQSAALDRGAATSSSSSSTHRAHGAADIQIFWWNIFLEPYKMLFKMYFRFSINLLRTEAKIRIKRAKYNWCKMSIVHGPRLSAPTCQYCGYLQQHVQVKWKCYLVVYCAIVLLEMFYGCV